MTRTAAWAPDLRSPTKEEQRIARRWDKGGIPRMVPRNVRLWKTVAMRQSEFFRVTNTVDRQVLAYKAAVEAGLTTVIELAHRRLAEVRRIRALCCRAGRLPVDDLLDAFAGVHVEPSPPKSPKKKLHRASDLRTLIESLAEGTQLPGTELLEDGSVFATTAALAALLDCSKSTVHDALKRLQDYAAISVVPTRKGTRIMLLRRRGELMNRGPIAPLAVPSASARTSLPEVGHLWRRMLAMIGYAAPG
jgi:hypothetical protein